MLKSQAIHGMISERIAAEPLESFVGRFHSAARLTALVYPKPDYFAPTSVLQWLPLGQFNPPNGRLKVFRLMLKRRNSRRIRVPLKKFSQQSRVGVGGFFRNRVEVVEHYAAHPEPDRPCGY